MAVKNIQIVREHCDFDIEKELRELGVSEIISFVAKGWRGFVFKARLGKKTVAVKVSSYDRILKEASVLRAANKIKVGPKVYGVSQHCVAMQFIRGVRYPEFVEKATKTQAKSAVAEIIRQAKALDKAGIDHGELSRADKHIIVGSWGRRNIGTWKRSTKPRSHLATYPRPRVYFIDFEKGSIARKTHNVGAVMNYLLLNPHSLVAQLTRTKLNKRVTDFKHYGAQNSRRKAESRAGPRN